jgi:hypothetical protein
MRSKPKLFSKFLGAIIMDRRDPHAFDGICELCGKLDELRPYGRGGKNVCFDCAMKDEAEAARQFTKRIQ